MVYDLGFDCNCKKDLSIKVNYMHSRNTEVSISCPWKIFSLSINSDLFRFSHPGLMASSFTNPAKSSESVLVNCERNKIVHLDLADKLQNTALPSPSDFPTSSVLLLSSRTVPHQSLFTLTTRPLFSFEFGR